MVLTVLLKLQRRTVSRQFPSFRRTQDSHRLPLLKAEVTHLKVVEWLLLQLEWVILIIVTCTDLFRGQEDGSLILQAPPA